MQTVSVTLDTQGRVRASKEQRRLILAEFERSGMSAARFAKQTGLKYSTLAGWLQRYRRPKPPGRARQVRPSPERKTKGCWCCNCPVAPAWRSAM